jgi:hypothetical protein
MYHREMLNLPAEELKAAIERFKDELHDRTMREAKEISSYMTERMKVSKLYSPFTKELFFQSATQSSFSWLIVFILSAGSLTLICIK